LKIRVDCNDILYYRIPLLDVALIQFNPAPILTPFFFKTHLCVLPLKPILCKFKFFHILEGWRIHKVYCNYLGDLKCRFFLSNFELFKTFYSYQCVRQQQRRAFWRRNSGDQNLHIRRLIIHARQGLVHVVIRMPWTEA